MKGYLLQSIAIPVWWLGMVFSEIVYSYFAFPGISRAAIFSFLAPDLILISLLSLWAWRQPGRVLQGCILGAFGYGALWCISASVISGGGFLSSIVMILGVLFNFMLLFGVQSFRMSTTSTRAWNVLKTLGQSVFIWAITLIVFPLGILHASGDWPLDVSLIPATMGLTGFVLFSTLGIWSGLVMATRGAGTPLPLDAPQRLVVSGPYAFVRNPMAIAGLGQGSSVAIGLQSVEVGVYVLAGIIIWNYFVRPEEEKYMAKTFGDAFLQYQSSVRCWLPRIKPYREA